MKEKYEVEENQLKVIITSQTEEVYSLDTLLAEKSRLETDIQYYQSKVADLDAKIAKCRELGILDAAEKAAKDEEEAAKLQAEADAEAGRIQAARENEAAAASEAAAKQAVEN